MKINFSKYHGTGNDFIIIDNRTLSLPIDETSFYAQLCHRRFGIGADGIILLQNHATLDFEMIYLNADGQESSMCGNGGRCIVAFAKRIGLIEQETTFMAVDGEHEGKIDDQHQVALKMQDVRQIDNHKEDYVLNTGSPHYVQFVKNLGKITVYETGQEIRHSEPFTKEGINVNFVEPTEKGLFIATYERGVEDETFSCGTGVVACSIAAYFTKKYPHTIVPVKTKGGNLQVWFDTPDNHHFTNIWLQGPAVHVFDGTFIVP